MNIHDANNGIKNNENLVYKKGITHTERINIIKAFVYPILLFVLMLFTIVWMKNYGRIVISVALAMMWGAAIVSAIYLPSHRKSALKGLNVAVVTYCVTLIILRIFIGVTSGINSDTLQASFNTTMPTTTGSTALGFLQTAFNIISISAPFGYLGYEIQRIVKLKRTSNVNKAISKERGIRDTNKNYQ